MPAKAQPQKRVGFVRASVAFISVIAVLVAASIPQSSWGGVSLPIPAFLTKDDSNTTGSNVTIDSDVPGALRGMGLEPILNDTITDPWKRELYGRLDRIRLICGDLCRLNDLAEIKRHTYNISGGGTFPGMVVVPSVNCPAILGAEEIDAGDLTFPGIPDELNKYFTLHGAVHVRTSGKLLKQGYLEGQAEMSVWEEADVDRMIEEAKNGKLVGSYSKESSKVLRAQLAAEVPDGLTNKSVLVIGSSHPWVEAICLSLGAKKVTTLEYGSIDSRHPRIATEVPKTFRKKYLGGELEQFDGIVTHSSVEHSGLGRYGDALNPWGDILTIARGWCVTKDGGFLYLGLPTGSDIIHKNWHRTYGRIRWPLVTMNWRQVAGNVTADNEALVRNPWAAQQFGGYGFLFTKVGETQLRDIANGGVHWTSCASSLPTVPLELAHGAVFVVLLLLF